MNALRMWALRDVGAEVGHHAGDLYVEFAVATLVAGTAEVPTKFKDGNIVAVFAMRNDDATVNAGQAFLTDKVVTSGAITISGPTGSTAVVTLMIVGRLDV